MKKQIKTVLSIVTITMLIWSCSTLGRSELEQAKEAKSENDFSKALMMASQALLQNPDLDGAKVFLRDNTDSMLDQLMDYLVRSEDKPSLDDLQNRFAIYSNLVVFYNNLDKVGLPIAADKKLFGLIKSWEWSTPILDFSADKEDARAQGRQGFYDAGRAAIQEGELSRAHGLMTEVVTTFAVKDSEQQAADYIAISEDFRSFAETFHGSKNPEELLKGIDAYGRSLKFQSDNASSIEGLAGMKKELSEVYMQLGIEKAANKDVESLKVAVAYFDSSLEYNPENKRAAELKAEVIERIAEFYYQQGLQYARNKENADNINKAIAAFEECLQWSPQYKDAELQRNRVYVSRELVQLSTNLTNTRNEFARTNERLAHLSNQVDKAHQGIEDLNYIADKVVQLDQQLLVLGQTASALSAIPVVGTVLSITSTSISKVRGPVKKAADKVKAIRRPVIDPARETIGSIKEKVDSLKDMMDQIEGSLLYCSQMVNLLNDCMAKQESAETVALVERDVKDINTILDTLNSGLSTVNAVQDSIEGALTALANAVSDISKVKGGIQTVMGPLDKIDSVTSEIYDVLQTKISIPFVGSFTVEEAIASTTGVIKTAAEAILNPILNELGIQIPSIPGIDELNTLLDSLTGYYDSLTSAYDELNSAWNDIKDVPGNLRDKVDSILETGNCPIN